MCYIIGNRLYCQNNHQKYKTFNLFSGTLYCRNEEEFQEDVKDWEPGYKWAIIFPIFNILGKASL